MEYSIIDGVFTECAIDLDRHRISIIFIDNEDVNRDVERE